MDYGYSPHREAGGTLHLPSPTHAHSYKDAFPSIKQIRKSLSRSPSKSPRFHLHDARSPSQSPRSPISPLAFTQASNTTPAGNPPVPSPLYDATHPVQATPVGKKGKLTLRRVAPFRSSPRTRTTSKSPVRRPLSEATNHGNSTPAFNHFRSSNSSDDSEGDNNTENTAPAQVAPSLPFDMNDGLTKFDFLKPRDAYTAALRCQMPAKSSPLKRSDGIMNLDQATLGSPSAKRRSLHGASFGADFNIFDQAQALGNGEQTNADFDSDFSFATPPPKESPIRKSLSLRKSTLVQRYGASASKTRPAPDAVSPFALPNQAASRSKLRMSLDGSTTARDNDTSSMFRQSLHQARPHSLYQQDGAWPEKTNALHASRHPLATALTPSSSSSSMADDSPTHNPAHVLTAINPYSRATRLQDAPLRKSLPIGATRPSAHPSANTSESSAYATPEAYKLAKPDPAAFMSTGLISKRNRNIEEPPLDESPNRVMPDTPSKRTSYPPMSSTPFAGAPFGKSTHTRPEFGTPSTPFSSHANKVSLESFGQGVSVFGARLGNAGLHRRGSFVSIDGDDASQSPTGRMESQSSADELPPTPTKPATASGRNSKENSLRSSLFGRRTSLGADTFIAPGTENVPPKTTRKSKLANFFTGQESDETEETASRRSTPSGSTSPDSSSVNPSPSGFGRAQQCESDGQSTPRTTKFLQIFASPCDGKNVTKTSLPQIASPTCTAEASEQTSPHTPQEHYNPPDPSTLSITARDRPLSASFNSSFSGRASFPPATPTAPRNENFYFAASHTGVPLFSGRVSVRNEIDTALSTRFKTVALHGTGEFSQVYRVENPTTPVGAQPGSSSVGQVWAVKKTKKAFIGVKDRERRRREVQILRALRGNDHVIRFDDSWEASGHLYIQTEYCDNGNLKDFLRVTGDKARLDDFRVWKILLELSMGVKFIHQSGYIHLDLKPANVFIDWEGVLKIGDFGLASPWPATSDSIDGEGDRQYISPEVLAGSFDKSADVFALGIILFEIGSNVVLPDNGASWQRLRSGDLSGMPSLTFSSDSTLARDESGDPISGLINNDSNDTLCFSELGDDYFKPIRSARPTVQRAEELVQPPQFMVDAEDPDSLDKLVQSMITPDPDHRPTIEHVFHSAGVQWVAQRRRAGASVYEGNWGPADDVLNAGQQDVLMADAI